MGYWDRIRKYMRGGPGAIDGWPDQIPIAEFNEAVEGMLGAALRGIGFETVRPRRWVRSTRAPIRHVLEIQALKGVSYCPMWGLSLDFVPHLTARGDVRWHRTPKSAEFDLVYRPIDYARRPEDAREWSMSPLATREELAEDVARVTRLTLAEAPRLWDRASATADLPGLYAEHRERPSQGLPYASFPQQALANVFVLAKTGADARPALAEYVRSYEVDGETARKLERLVDG